MIKSTKNLLFGLLFGALTTSAIALPARAGSFYISTDWGQVGVLDDTSGDYTRLAWTPSMTDIALDAGGQLWGITYSSLYAVDLDAGTYSNVGAVGANLNALGFTDDGILYGAGRSGFYQIDTNSGAASLKSTLAGFLSSGDIVFDAARDLFWATSQGDTLWTITRDGVGTRVGNIGYRSVYGLAFGDDDTLYGYTSRGTQLALNLETGAGTFVREVSHEGDIWGAASDPGATAPPEPVSTPEPSVLLGLASVAALFRRKAAR